MKRAAQDAAIVSSAHDVENLRHLLTRAPRLGAIIDTEGAVVLGDGATLVIVHDVLNGDVLRDYTSATALVERRSGIAAFGHRTPRAEVAYTRDGKPYTYSGVRRYTTAFPDHVLRVLPLFMSSVDRYIADNLYRRHDTAVDICYAHTQVRGGSIGRHKDDENADWGLVVVYSLGQTRWLRVRRDTDGRFYNVALRHNSLVAMHGAAFQRNYTHQVDKLHADEGVGTRFSLNVRYLVGDESFV